MANSGESANSADGAVGMYSSGDDEDVSAGRSV